MDTNRAYMLDTNIFDRLLDSTIPHSSLTGRRLLVTGIQRDELARAKEKRGENLLQIHDEVVNPEKVLASSFSWGIEGAGLDQAYWNDGSGTFKKMLERLQQLDSTNWRRKDPINQQRDTLIAETAIKNKAVLVSDDSNLCQVVREFGGDAISSAGFIAARP